MVHTLKGQIFDVVEVTNLLLVSKIPEIEKISYSSQLQLFAIQTGGPNYRHVNSP